jgi:hypothetical protein
MVCGTAAQHRTPAQSLICLSPRLPRLIRVEASNTAGRVHQLQAFLLFLRGRHYTFVYCSFNLVVGRKILWYFKLKILRGL